MSEYTLADFVRETREVVMEGLEPADNVEKLVPLMYKLLSGDKSFLRPEHFQSDPDHYARNAIYIDDGGVLSLYALVWEPGQWTPIHDHGTWGVVGVHEGLLEECSFIRTDGQTGTVTRDIDLVRGGVIMLPPYSVTSFVPNPDHIHITGNPTERRTVSLHLYGNAMAGFYVYDRQANSRKWMEVQHNES